MRTSPKVAVEPQKAWSIIITNHVSSFRKICIKVIRDNSPPHKMPNWRRSEVASTIDPMKGMVTAATRFP
eukprot:CAMPEP_0185797244 /NCGR_PEP_ID=MMETSP1174-20130828/161513_1 /TAXON_ID=35687 /ORGANISM="Dictyocha speculum, Strain CCMP1381" /LENGTH=69 /DNA_ID=CAMNT_0028492665 /DNA_START=2210 /DNA_END=2416 /DNA_ORIENTATION=+